MSPNEYASKIGNGLRKASRHGDAATVKKLCIAGDNWLVVHNITVANKGAFWNDVQRAALNGPWHEEGQANDAFMLLMRTILRGLSARTGR